jgi:hypothetical protein
MAYSCRAISKAELYDTQGSLSDFNKAILLEKDKPENYYFRGLLYINLKNKKLACADFSKAGELGFMKAYEEIKKHCN